MRKCTRPNSAGLSLELPCGSPYLQFTSVPLCRCASRESSPGRVQIPERTRKPRFVSDGRIERDTSARLCSLPPTLSPASLCFLRELGAAEQPMQTELAGCEMLTPDRRRATPVRCVIALVVLPVRETTFHTERERSSANGMARGRIWTCTCCDLTFGPKLAFHFLSRIESARNDFDSESAPVEIAHQITTARQLQTDVLFLLCIGNLHTRRTRFRLRNAFVHCIGLDWTALGLSDAQHLLRPFFRIACKYHNCERATRRCSEKRSRSISPRD